MSSESLDDFIQEVVEEEVFNIQYYVDRERPFDYLSMISNMYDYNEDDVIDYNLDAYNYFKKNDYLQDKISHQFRSLLHTYEILARGYFENKT